MAICRIPSSISAKSAQKSKSRFPIDRLFDTNADETHTESNGIIEAPLIPDTFEDPHDCCANTCSPMPEATDADQGTNNDRNTKETSD